MPIDIEKMKKGSSSLVFIIITVAFIYALVKLMIFKYAKDDAQRAEKSAAVCPALLSIGRSSRDTLIVMKAEPLCNEYVLENFK